MLGVCGVAGNFWYKLSTGLWVSMVYRMNRSAFNVLVCLSNYWLETFGIEVVIVRDEKTTTLDSSWLLYDTSISRCGSCLSQNLTYNLGSKHSISWSIWWTTKTNMASRNCFSSSTCLSNDILYGAAVIYPALELLATLSPMFPQPVIYAFPQILFGACLTRKIVDSTCSSFQHLIIWLEVEYTRKFCWSKVSLLACRPCPCIPVCW